MITEENLNANSIKEAKLRLACVDARHATLLAEIAGAKAQRSAAAREALLDGASPSKGWSAAIADENAAQALLNDLEALRPELLSSLLAAERKLQYEAEAEAAAAFEFAFKTRLAEIMAEHNITVPSGRDANFEQDVRHAYDWLAGMPRIPAVNTKHALSYWLDAMLGAGKGSIHPVELIAAARVHGDIIIQDGGEAWNRFLGIDQCVGRAAKSTPLLGNADRTPTPAAT